MKLTSEQVGKLERFMDRVKGETYPETPSAMHDNITGLMLEHLWKVHAFPAGTRVLDVGCGQGVALSRFAERGCDPVGIGINDVDLQACRKAGFKVQEMDMSFLDFPDGEFDLIWCRHCLEHSIFPYFTLSEFKRVLKPGGWLYIEVPAVDTNARHQNNKNHYSVLTKSMWAELISRSGFNLLDHQEIRFQVPVGPDLYLSFIAQSK